MVITWSCVFTFAGVLEVHLRILVAFGYFIPYECDRFFFSELLIRADVRKGNDVRLESYSQVVMGLRLL